MLDTASRVRCRTLPCMVPAVDAAPTLTPWLRVHPDTGWLVSSVTGVVVETFLGPIPDGYEVNHLNGRKTDNRLINLEPVTHAENVAHAVATGLRALGKDRDALPGFDSGRGRTRGVPTDQACPCGCDLGRAPGLADGQGQAEPPTGTPAGLGGVPDLRLVRVDVDRSGRGRGTDAAPDVLVAGGAGAGTVSDRRGADGARRLTDACRAGHAWTPANTYVRVNGTRQCRACKAATQRRRYQRDPGRELAHNNVRRRERTQEQRQIRAQAPLIEGTLIAGLLAAAAT